MIPPTSTGWFKSAADEDKKNGKSFDVVDIIKKCYEDHKESADPELIIITGIQYYDPPYEEGKNIGAVELIYNRHGHRAIYGLYLDGGIHCFAD